MKVNKFFSLITLAAFIAGCGPVAQEVTLDLFVLNDFHGAIHPLEGTTPEYGIHKIASYLKAQAAANPGGTINMDAGDMWQGTADSNITRGRVLVEMLNSLDWAATTLGNHEFDWYDTVIEENKTLADYPFLGANIINRDSGELAENIVDAPSVMVKRNGVKVGIIGTIGSWLESSIIASAVGDYSFEPVTDYIIEEANALRKDGAQLIVLLTHDSLTGYTRSSEYGPILEPEGKDPYVDVVFSGHFHQKHNELINGVPVLQSNGNGKQVMHVNLSVTGKEVVINEYQLVDQALANYEEEPTIAEIYARYEGDINLIKNEVVGELSASMSKTQIARLATKVMLEAASEDFVADVAVHNTGGIRDELIAGTITYGDIYKTLPFDNTVVVVEDVLGSVVSAVMSGNEYTYRDGLDYIDANEYYTLVTINFISENNSNLSYFPQSTLENVFVRDLLADYFRAQEIVNPSLI